MADLRRKARKDLEGESAPRRFAPIARYDVSIIKLAATSEPVLYIDPTREQSVSMVELRRVEKINRV